MKVWKIVAFSIICLISSVVGIGFPHMMGYDSPNSAMFGYATGFVTCLAIVLIIYLPRSKKSTSDSSVHGTREES